MRASFRAAAHPRPARRPGTGRRAPRRVGAEAAALLGRLMGGRPSKPADVGVVIVDHGSKVASANEALGEVVALYKARTGTAIVEPAHMELAEPSVGEAVAKCVAAGARTVVVSPYFLGRGRHVREDIPRLVEASQAAHPATRVVLADPLGLEPRLADVIEARVGAALARASP